MKDGIYAVQVNDGGRMIIVRGEVRHGIFRGLDDIAHLTGLFMADGPPVVRAEASNAAGARPTPRRTVLPIDSDQAFQHAWHRALIDEALLVRRQFHDRRAWRSFGAEPPITA